LKEREEDFAFPLSSSFFFLFPFFFKDTTRLPLELQMMLCFRQVGSDKEILSGKDSEVAFKELAKGL